MFAWFWNFVFKFISLRVFRKRCLTNDELENEPRRKKRKIEEVTHENDMDGKGDFERSLSQYEEDLSGNETVEDINLPELTPAMLDMINYALFGGPASEIVSKKHGVGIKRSDLQCLKPGELPMTKAVLISTVRSYGWSF